MAEQSRKLLWKADDLAAQERAVTQRLKSELAPAATGLSRLAGLKRAHVSLGRIPPGKDSFAYHAHMQEEEWVYILSGRGIAEIDGESYKVGRATSWVFRRLGSRICCATHTTPSWCI